MTTVSIKDQLRKLVELQEIDTQIYEHKKQLREKPAHLQELKEIFELKKAHLNEMQDKLKKTQVGQKDMEGQLQAREQEIAKANSVLPQLKTNKEYQAKISEIEHIKADQSILEEKVLMTFDEIDAINGEINKEKEVLAQKEKEYLAQKKEVEDEVRLLEDKVKVLNNKRVQLTPEMDANILERYEKVLKNKEGLALVPVRNNSCNGCYMNVTAQMLNEIKMYERIVSCEMCARILYLEEDL